MLFLISSIPNTLGKVLAVYLRTCCAINQTWNTKLGGLKIGPILTFGLRYSFEIISDNSKVNLQNLQRVCPKHRSTLMSHDEGRTLSVVTGGGGTDAASINLTASDFPEPWWQGQQLPLP